MNQFELSIFFLFNGSFILSLFSLNNIYITYKKLQYELFTLLLKQYSTYNTSITFKTYKLLSIYNTGHLHY